MADAALPTTPQPAELAGDSLLRQTMRRIGRQTNALIGATMLGIVVLVAVFAPLLATHDPIEVIQEADRRSPPCVHVLGCPTDQQQYLLGVDGNDRDFYSRIIFGSRLSLLIGFTTIGFAIVIGSLIGAVAGFLGGWMDQVLMRLMDVLLAFPALLLAIAIVTVLGPGLTNAMLAIGIVSIPVYARIVRASVLSAKEETYVEASRALGAGVLHILFRRIMPNVLTPLIVQGTLGIATAIIDTAALSFLGFGAQPPTPEWGSMLGTERSQLFSAPHLVIFPGLAITFTVLAFNLLGDGLRDALDPRLARSDRA